MKLKCRIFGHKLGFEIFEYRSCIRTGCNHVEPARERPPCPPMLSRKIIISEFEPATGELVIDPRWKGEPVEVWPMPKHRTIHYRVHCVDNLTPQLLRICAGFEAYWKREWKEFRHMWE